MTKYIVSFGQSLYDVAVMVYGDISKVWDLIDDNNLVDGLDTDLVGGQELNIRPFTGNTISQYFVRYEQTINNSDYEDTGILQTLKVVLKEIGNENLGDDGYILVDIIGGVADYVFEWKDQITDVIVANSQNLTGAQAGTYTITVVDSEGTSFTLSNLTISVVDNTIYLVDDEGNLITDDFGNPIVVNQ